MNDTYCPVARWWRLACLVACALNITACSGDSWKEEVLLHDGQKIIVERSQTYKGNSEIGQPTPAGEHTVRFKLPGSGKQLSWTSEYGEDLGRTNFNLLAIHLKHKIQDTSCRLRHCNAESMFVVQQMGAPQPALRGLQTRW